MLQIVKLQYHQYMEVLYSPFLQDILGQSSTNAKMIQNAGRLERLCQAQMSHTQAIVTLTPEGSVVHGEATERLSALEEVYKNIQQYIEIGDLAEQMFGRRTFE